MAEYLASIFGTEKDKVNCSFYFKIGACRHGDRCSRIHNKPNFSQTVLILNLYCNPQNSAKSADGSHSTVSDEEMQEHYDLFFEEVFVELEDNYGEIEEMNVCDNLGDHLVGNVYIKFKYEEDAKRAVEDLNNRWFNRRPMYAELSPVTDFREACCRQYEMGECTRSGFCNFMHLKPISRELRRELYSRKILTRSGRRHRHKHKKERRRRRRQHSKSRSPHSSSKSPYHRRSPTPQRRSKSPRYRHSRSPRPSKSPRRISKSPPNYHPKSPRRSLSPYHHSRSPLITRRSPSQKARSPLLPTRSQMMKTPLIASKPPLISKTPLMPCKMSGPQTRSPLISKTPLMKTPLIAKPPIVTSKCTPQSFSLKPDRLKDRRESMDPSPKRLNNRGGLKDGRTNDAAAVTEKQSPARHNINSNKPASIAKQQSPKVTSTAPFEEEYEESPNNSNKKGNPDRNNKKNTIMMQQQHSLMSEDMSGQHNSMTAIGGVSCASLSKPSPSRSNAVVATMAGAAAAAAAAAHLSHAGGGSIQQQPQQHFQHPLLSTIPTTAHHPLTSASLHHPHHHAHHHHSFTTNSSNAFSHLAHHHHPFSHLTTLAPHLQTASTFSSPLMPGPPPHTPLLLSGVIGGFGRNMMGGLLAPSIALPQLRYSNFGGRRSNATAPGTPTLQEQLAKAAAAARMNRPY